MYLGLAAALAAWYNITTRWLLYLCIPVSASTAENWALKSAGGCHGPQGHGIITATRLLYLCIPVSASTAENRALKSAGGCHGPQGHGMTVGNIIYLFEKQQNSAQ